jgi:hypothetical protein
LSAAGVSHENSPKSGIFTSRNPKRIFIGSGTINDNLAVIAPHRSYPFSLVNVYGLPSTLGDGHVGLHFMSAPRYTPPPTLSQCEMDGSKGCVTLPLKDFCADSILSERCLPQALSPDVSDPFALAGEVANAERIPSGAYTVRSAGEVTFVASSLTSSDSDNQRLCADLVRLSKRSAFDDRDNPACQLRNEPSATAKDGKLACRYSVSFVAPNDVADFACTVTAVFLGDTPEVQSVQLLYLGGPAQ